jgi:hypothetical protein
MRDDHACQRCVRGIEAARHLVMPTDPMTLSADRAAS